MNASQLGALFLLYAEGLSRKRIKKVSDTLQDYQVTVRIVYVEVAVIEMKAKDEYIAWHLAVSMFDKFIKEHKQFQVDFQIKKIDKTVDLRIVKGK